MLNPRWRKVLHDLFENRTRTMLVVASIAVGVIAFGSLFVTRYLLLQNLDDQYKGSNPYDISIRLSAFGDEVVRWAARQSYVTGAEALTIYAANLYCNDKKFDVTLHAFSDYNDVQINRIAPQQGTWPPERGQIFLERSYVQQVGLQLGDTITIETRDGIRQRLQVAGTLYDINVQPGTFSRTVQAYVAPRTLFNLSLSTDYNTLYLTVDRSLQDISTPSLSKITGELRREMIRLGMPVQSIATNTTGKHWATDTLNGLVTVLVVVGTVSLVLSGFLVFNSISSFLLQQKKQIGIMKIIGAGRGQIITIYMVMVASFGALALVIALPMSLVVARGLSNAVGRQLNLSITDFQMPLYILILEVAVAFLAPMLSALMPVVNATRISAAQAISDHRPASKHSLLDVLLACIGGLPRPLVLSIRNVFRSRLRLVMTLITLVLAGGFFITVINVREAVRISINDFLGMTNFDIHLILDKPYNGQIAEHLLSIPGVVAVENNLIRSVPRVEADGLEGGNLPITGLTYDSQFIDPPINEGRWLEAPDRYNRYDLVITTELANNEDIRLGDVLTLRLNSQKEDWRVVGIVRAMTPMAYGYYDSVSNFAQLVDMTSALMIGTTQEDEAFQQRVTDEIATYLDDRDIEISQTQLRATSIKGIIGGFDVVIGMLLFTSIMIAVVGGLGLAGTMSMSVIERVREIGVMRSVGASTNTLRLMFIAEGIFIGTLSTLMAMALSIPMTGAFATALGNAMFGWPFPSVLTIAGPILWIIIALAVATLASLAPAQRASQISIREALAYE